MCYLPIRHMLKQAQELEEEALKPHDPFKSQHLFARAEDPFETLECKAPSGKVTLDDEKMRKLFPFWKAHQASENACPYCGCVTPRAFKIYKHPKDGDCVGIYTCDHCGKRWVKDGKVQAEVW